MSLVCLFRSVKSSLWKPDSCDMKALHVKRNFVSEPSASPTNRVGPAFHGRTCPETTFQLLVKGATV